MAKKKPSTVAPLINLNTAETHELLVLPNIGSQRAQQIITLRPFSSWSDFQARVAGFRGKDNGRLSALRELATITQVTTQKTESESQARGKKRKGAAKKVKTSASKKSVSFASSTSFDEKQQPVAHRELEDDDDDEGDEAYKRAKAAYLRDPYRSPLFIHPKNAKRDDERILGAMLKPGAEIVWGCPDDDLLTEE